MDAWTSPNHKAFIAVTMHMEHSGKPVTFVLDVVEVTSYILSFHMISRLLDSSVQAHSGINLASAFMQILDEFGISEKVCTLAFYLSSNMNDVAIVSQDHMQQCL